MKFEFTIESDNDDNGPEMVADNLDRVASRVMDGDREGTLRDGNGNPVGTWKMTES